MGSASSCGDRHLRLGVSREFPLLCTGIALTHSPEAFNVIFVDMKFESAAGTSVGLPARPGRCRTSAKDDRHLAERDAKGHRR